MDSKDILSFKNGEKLSYTGLAISPAPDMGKTIAVVGGVGARNTAMYQALLQQIEELKLHEYQIMMLNTIPQNFRSLYALSYMLMPTAFPDFDFDKEMYDYSVKGLSKQLKDLKAQLKKAKYPNEIRKINEEISGVSRDLARAKRSEKKNERL